MHLNDHAKLSVAPMMNWTDRCCRFFHRLLSREVLLYTEMVTAPALVKGGALHLLEFAPEEHPLAVQLGGSNPEELAQATRLCVERGFDEVNLNVGCPSDRVQSGAFGAVLMNSPDLVAKCVAHMQEAAGKTPITVKCRIGVDNQIPEETLPAFLEKMQSAGVQRLTIHARKAWLKGLSPKQNREVPPLNYPLVYQMKADFPKLHISLNGGVESLSEAKNHLLQGLDGVMIGRAAYHNPVSILATADQDIFNQKTTAPTARQAVEKILPFAEHHISKGGRLHDITRHMLGTFTGQPGARIWRRMLSEGATRPGAGPELIQQALDAID